MDYDGIGIEEFERATKKAIALMDRGRTIEAQEILNAVLLKYHAIHG